MPRIRRQQTFMQSLHWTGYILLLMGFIFLCVAVVIQLVPLSPENMSTYVNGVRQPTTEHSVNTFRLVFLLTFGLIGLILAIVGGVITHRRIKRRRNAAQLKENGVRLIAQAVDYESSNVNINNRNLVRLCCAYTDFSGKTFIFKSDLLRMDPWPYLDEGKVTVYHDRDNMSRYFVDIDGSVGLGSKVVEL